MRGTAYRTGLGRTFGRAAMLIAAWQLVGCAATHRSVVIDYSGSDELQAGYSVGQELYGPPASAAVANRSDQFSVSHPRVNDFVNTFQTRWRGFYQQALERGNRYLPKMTRVLRDESVPVELAYLPLIESGFRTQAVSQAGAVGPWQFIPATGRRYGLRIDGYVDERRDPVKSTYAAARYLKELYAQFGDWHLSLAAYNTGEMNIIRILERSNADDYWEMSERGYLPNETSNFVPQFLAAVRIAQSPEAYGFDAPSTAPVHYDLVRVDHSVSLKTVAKIANTNVSEINELNPALRRGVTPPQGYTVRVPKGTKEIVEIALARLRYDAAQVVPAHTVVAKTYKLRKGQTLAAIAKRHHVTVASLMKANGIHDARRTTAGRTLRIPGKGSAAKVAGSKKPIRVASRKSR